MRFCRKLAMSRNAVAATNSNPSGRVRAINAAAELAVKWHQNLFEFRKMHPNTHNATQKPNIAVSRPELVHARKVRFVNRNDSKQAVNISRQEVRRSLRRIFIIIKAM